MIVPQGDFYLDQDTGEVLTVEAYALHLAALEAAQSFAAYDRARLDLADLQRQIDAEVVRQFPHLVPLQESVMALKKAHDTRIEALRGAALGQHQATGEKSFLGGIVGVATTTRKAHYDAQLAHDWCVEMNRFDLLKPDEKALTELAKADQLPKDIMRFEPVAETRVSEAKLASLVSE